MKLVQRKQAFVFYISIFFIVLIGSSVYLFIKLKGQERVSEEAEECVIMEPSSPAEGIAYTYLGALDYRGTETGAQ